MTTIAINTFMTLDGVAQAPGGPNEDVDGGFEHGGWQAPYFTAQLGEIVYRWHSNSGGILLGRRTFDIFAAHWPKIPADHEHAAMAKIINDSQKYVASRTVSSSDWENTTFLGDDVPAAVAELKKQDLGELMVIGSLDLAQTLIRHNLIDEFRLTVFPIVLGTGKRLFGDGAIPAGLELVSTETTDSGVVACVYRPAGEVSYGSYEL